VFQNDLKKVIAYSTCSQLGYMVFACGLSHYHIAMFHLVTHAFFKALLFLSAGSVIHGVADEQDMRKMGGLLKLLPFTYICMVVGSLALAGFPFLSGYYSKELILEIALGAYTTKGFFVYLLGCTAAFFTAFYSTRLIALVFLIKPNGSATVYKNAHDAPIFITISLFTLVIFSIFTGYLTKDMFVGLGNDLWHSAIFIKSNHELQVDSEFLPFYLKLIPLGFSFTGIVSSLLFYTKYTNIIYTLKQFSFLRQITEFFTKKWYFDIVYNWFGARAALNLGYNITFKTVDRGLLELFGPLGIKLTINNFINKFKHIQSGYIYNYALIITISVVVFVGLVFFYTTTIFVLKFLIIFIFFQLLSN